MSVHALDSTATPRYDGLDHPLGPHAVSNLTIASPSAEMTRPGNLSGRIVLFPVRHHSPTAARLVRDLIVRLCPGAVLIEGPADFNERMDELFLPHRPPLAIYSFFRRDGGVRRGAYYPLCEHSPEWQALRTAHERNIPVRFIDLSWADVAADNAEPANRYGDAEFRRSDYIATLLRRLGVEDFDALWDTLFELDPSLSLETYQERCHTLCGNMRLLDGTGSANDRRREAFMTARIRETLPTASGPILVVTGGYHSLALHVRLTGGVEPPGFGEPAECEPTPPGPGEERGIALTPYSFERLDSLIGYEAGMPNPGFYQEVWRDRHAGRADTYRTLLVRIAERLRQRNQAVSAADLIAAETTARGLAALRGHPQVWRTDLVDGLTSALIKDELALGGRHPLLDAVHEVLRGGERGQLAAGTLLPPLTRDIHERLDALDLKAGAQARDLELELERADERQRSRVLHRLRLLGVRGYDRTAGTDLVSRDDLSRVRERWHIAWSPDFEAGCIENARYGPTLAEAAAARLAERSAGTERDAGAAALLLLDAALAGLTAQSVELLRRLRELIRSDGDFFQVGAALGHLLYLYRYDAVLETAGRGEIGVLVRDAFQRGLWLLESLGQIEGRDRELLQGVSALRDVFERCGETLGLDRDELVQVLGRVGADRGQRPAACGAALGALWSLAAAQPQQVRTELRRFADADRLGDFLSGLFALAREPCQRQRDLLLAIHELITRYAGEEFLSALPALRLAFTYFTPREKHHLALTLREALGLHQEPELAALVVDEATAARALAFEERLFETVRRYGLRDA